MEEKRLLHCSNCRAVSYCSKSCQRKDWGQHKAICLAIQGLSERNDVYNDLGSDALPVYPTTLTPKEQTKIAKLIGQKCTMFCRIDGVEIKVLLDTDAQVSIMSYQDLVSNFPGIKVHTIEELLESGVDLELTTANGTQLPYLGWIETTIVLKGPSKKLNKVIVPMLITGATLDLPIIGYNVLEELLSIGGLENSEYNLLGQLSTSFPMMHETNLIALLNAVFMEREAYLSTVKTCKRDTVIKAGYIAKLSCRVNTGFFARDTQVILKMM